MPTISSLFAALALALSPPPPGAAVVEKSPTAAPVDKNAEGAALSVWQVLSDGFRPSDAAQARIEQHIIWRISPMPGPSRDNLTAFAAQAQAAPRMSERKMAGCIPMNWIAGGQAQGGSRLLLFLRDRRMVAADLERACSARDFYSGFYVDKPDADGRICAGRDRILARSGARCSISSFRLLVADD